MTKAKISKPQETQAPKWVIPMRRFVFETGTVPEVGGFGVSWVDNTSAYREYMRDGTSTYVMCASVDDIEHQYGGQPGYKFTWLD